MPEVYEELSGVVRIDFDDDKVVVEPSSAKRLNVVPGKDELKDGVDE